MSESRVKTSYAKRVQRIYTPGDGLAAVGGQNKTTISKFPIKLLIFALKQHEANLQLWTFSSRNRKGRADIRIADFF